MAWACLLVRGLPSLPTLINNSGTPKGSPIQILTRTDSTQLLSSAMVNQQLSSTMANGDYPATNILKTESSPVAWVNDYPQPNLFHKDNKEKRLVKAAFELLGQKLRQACNESDKTVAVSFHEGMK